MARPDVKRDGEWFDQACRDLQLIGNTDACYIEVFEKLLEMLGEGHLDQTKPFNRDFMLIAMQSMMESNQHFEALGIEDPSEDEKEEFLEARFLENVEFYLMINSRSRIM